MIELHPPQYETIRSLFRSIPHHLTLESLLAGKSAGKVFVDDPNQPRVAVAWTSHRVFLGGNPGRDTNRALAELLTHTQMPPEFGLYYTPEWEPALGDLGDCHFGSDSHLAHRGLRHYYTGNTIHHDWRALLPKGFTLRPIDATLLTETQLKNLHHLVNELKSERESITTFLWHSFGFCALYEDEIVGWCTSEYNTGTRCEVGIATIEDYQRKGIATALASALIEHALANGYTEIGWHCWANNPGSVATARKLGLEKVAEYPTYIVIRNS